MELKFRLREDAKRAKALTDENRLAMSEMAFSSVMFCICY